jgi:hypothetical protein
MTNDEDHVHPSGFVNKQNFRYWSSKNPIRFYENPLHSANVTVWCAILSSRIVGPYFFEDGDGRTITVNSQPYVSMFDKFLAPESPPHPVNEDNKTVLRATSQGFPSVL